MAGITAPIVQYPNGMMVIPAYPTESMDGGIGSRGIPNPQAESASQLFPLGSLLFWEDKIFRYTKAGATALVRGKVNQAAAKITGHTNRPVKEAVAAGIAVVNVDPVTTSITANEYRDGYFHVNDADGEGQPVHRIKGNTAATHDDTGSLQYSEVTLYEGLKIALTANSEVTLTKNKYDSVIVTPVTTLTAMVLGVNPIAVTAAYFFWLQVAGPSAVLANGTVVLGDPAVVPNSVAGAVGPRTTALVVKERVVGDVLVANVDTEYALIDLQLFK